MVMIVVIQLYFLIQLWELWSRLFPADLALEVAWIGFYPGFLARMVSILTAVICPLGVLFSLALKQGFSWMSVTVLAGAGCLAAITTILLYLINKRSRTSRSDDHVTTRLSAF